jgi:hypothetical protein
MDFIVGLKMTRIGLDNAFLVGDKFSKMSPFIPCKKTHYARNIVNLFFKEVVKIHGLSRSIVANRDVKFMGHFWKTLWKRLEINLAHSSTYHPQIDG